jgi:hypothetical protein
MEAVYELRTAVQSMQIVNETSNLSGKEKESLLKAIGMRNVKVSSRCHFVTDKTTSVLL